MKKKTSNLIALCAFLILCSACKTTKTLHQSAILEQRDSVRTESHATKNVDSLVVIKLHNQENVLIIQETFIPVADTVTGQVYSVLSARTRIFSHSEKDSTSVFLHSENEEQQEQVSATSNTQLNIQNDEERKSSTGFPYIFFVFLLVLALLFIRKIK
jgi:hypothetical protein